MTIQAGPFHQNLASTKRKLGGLTGFLVLQPVLAEGAKGRQAEADCLNSKPKTQFGFGTNHNSVIKSRPLESTGSRLDWGEERILK